GTAIRRCELIEFPFFRPCVFSGLQAKKSAFFNKFTASPGCDSLGAGRPCHLFGPSWAGLHKPGVGGKLVAHPYETVDGRPAHHFCEAQQKMICKFRIELSQMQAANNLL